MLYKCIMENTSAHTTYQLSSPSCSTRAIQKSLTLNKKYLSFLEKSQENGPLAEKLPDRKSERKKTRGDRKGESNDSPEIPDRRLTSDIPGLPLGFDHAIHLNSQSIYLNSSRIHLNSSCIRLNSSCRHLNRPCIHLNSSCIHLNSSCIYT